MANEYINADKNILTFEFLSHDEVIELAESDQNSDSSERESEHEVEEIKSEEAKDCIRKLRRYLEKNATDKTIMNNLLAAEKDIEKIIVEKKTQTSILKYYFPAK